MPVALCVPVHATLPLQSTPFIRTRSTMSTRRRYLAATVFFAAASLGVALAFGLPGSDVGNAPHGPSKEPALFGVRIGDAKADLDRRGILGECSDNGGDAGCSLVIPKGAVPEGGSATVSFQAARVIEVALTYHGNARSEPMDAQTRMRLEEVWAAVEDAFALRYGAPDIVNAGVSMTMAGGDTWFTSTVWLEGSTALTIDRTFRPLTDERGGDVGIPLVMGHHTPLRIEIRKGPPPGALDAAQRRRRGLERRLESLTGQLASQP